MVDFSPLLPIGRHPYTLPALRTLCVDGFNLSATRETIMQGLEGVVAHLNSAGITGELWVDGSFVTEKINPGDVDLVLKIGASLAESPNRAQWDALQWFLSGLKITHHCDSYVLVAYPEGHRNYWDGEYWEAYWMRQWGFDRSQTLKGIAVVKLPT